MGTSKEKIDRIHHLQRAQKGVNNEQDTRTVSIRDETLTLVASIRTSAIEILRP